MLQFAKFSMCSAAVLIAAMVAGCTKDDVGTCCKTLDDAKTSLVPLFDPAKPLDDVSRNPAFDCDAMNCVVYRASPKAYCTRKCTADTECPGGFVCAPVLQSEPCDSTKKTVQTDDDCEEGAILASDKFCVAEAHRCEGN